MGKISICKEIKIMSKKKNNALWPEERREKRGLNGENRFSLCLKF